MRDRRQRPEYAGIGDEDVELLPALIDRRPELIDLVVLLQVELQQRRRAAQPLDLVVEALERGEGTRGDDDVGAGVREAERNGAANAAGSPGDEGKAAVEGGEVMGLYLDATELSPSSL